MVLIQKLNGDSIKLPIALEDGTYIISISRLNSTDANELRRAFFYLVEYVHKETGNDKSFIYERFKQEEEIESAKGFTSQEWHEAINKFKWHCFNNYDIML